MKNIKNEKPANKVPGRGLGVPEGRQGRITPLLCTPGNESTGKEIPQGTKSGKSGAR